MESSKKITFVTGNKHKVEEVQQILDSIKIDSVDVDIEEIQGTPYEVIVHKAKSAYNELKKPIIVDDVCFHVKAWNNLPGPYIKYFQKSLGAERLAQLILSDSDGKAHVSCWIGYAISANEIYVVEGRVEGRVVVPRGSGGWGFDPMFLQDGYEETWGQMDDEVKNKDSHRTRALKLLKKGLETGKWPEF